MVQDYLSPEEQEALKEKEELKEDVLFFLLLAIGALALGWWITT